VIARVWHGRTPRDVADDFHAYIRQTGEADFRATSGNRGVLVLRRTAGEVAEFWMISLWDDVESIRTFAGPDIDRSHYPYPRDQEFLLELEPTVAHYEVISCSGLTPAPL
jgi:hypothetical protein